MDCKKIFLLSFLYDFEFLKIDQDESLYIIHYCESEIWSAADEIHNDLLLNVIKGFSASFLAQQQKSPHLRCHHPSKGFFPDP